MMSKSELAIRKLASRRMHLLPNNETLSRVDSTQTRWPINLNFLELGILSLVVLVPVPLRVDNIID
jgi:hypothetical protein